MAQPQQPEYDGPVYAVKIHLYIRKPENISELRALLETTMQQPDSLLHRLLRQLIPSWQGKSCYTTVGRVGAEHAEFRRYSV
jgi:hypothetical protein